MSFVYDILTNHDVLVYAFGNITHTALDSETASL